MVLVESLTMVEFRGIRNLTLELKKKNFAVCGPNGTGKSGVVDAIEFVLTGNIARLSGEGKGEVSIEEHAPHVDSRSNPQKALVRASIVIPSVGGKTFTIERSAKTPKMFTLSPASEEAAKVIQFLSAHPEIVLSRRELIRYVLATPGKRDEEVRALLHLDSVNDVRMAFARILKTCTRSVTAVDADLKRSRVSLLTAMDITALTLGNILAATNERRATLALPAIAELTAKTSLKDGVTTAAAKPQKIVKSQALLDQKTVADALSETILSAEWQAMTQKISDEIGELSRDPAARTGVTMDSFYNAGLSLIEKEACPFCDTEWDLAKLKAHIQSKLDSLKYAAKKREDLAAKISAHLAPLSDLTYALNSVFAHAANAAPKQLMLQTRAFRQATIGRVEALAKLTPFDASLAAIESLKAGVPAQVTEELEALAKYVTELPDPNKEQAARDWLLIASEKFDAFNNDRRRDKKARDEAERATDIAALYSKVSDAYLTGIYDAVQEKFSEYYRVINSNDESKFEAKLKPSLGKLGFNVDFYGRGLFPAGAYHSEGHQDSMGLCLYLALMKHLHGDSFTIAIFDDVLMSVDSGHRREVCALLKKEFPRTQFVMTTHDPIWLKHMRTEGLISGKSAMMFKTWDVGQGPTLLDDRDIWKEIEDHLKTENVREAAGALRHYLEYVSGELCHALRAPVEYRGDAAYQLGDMLPSAIGRMRKYFTSGIAAAKSWGRDDLAAEIAARDQAFAALATASNIEQWQINALIHYNSWANLTPKELAVVVAAFKALIEGFQCFDCGRFVAAVPERSTAEVLRCGCGKISISLTKK